jgi:hypothetical protein
MRKGLVTTSDRYRLSFTTGGLFLQEAPLIATRYLALRDWAQTREQMRAENLLQVRTAATATRVSQELIARLELLDFEELQYLTEASSRERGYLLWSAACRRYIFIRDFAQEVLREHYLSLRGRLTASDYDTFCNAKALWHAELDEIAPSTQSKLRQNLFRMLREADLISTQLQIQPALLTPPLARLLARQSHEPLLVFPVTDHDMQRWLQ